MKQIIQGLLQTMNYRLTYAPRGSITGINLVTDLRMLVPTLSPMCFDVGANCGQTIALFQEIFDQPRIHSFEPSSLSFQELQSRNYGAQVSLHNFALGCENAKQEFLNYEESVLSSFLAFDPAEENRFRNVKIKSKEIVEVKSIDWFVQQNQIKQIDILKTDTQGYDFQVLKGATETLQQGLIQTVFIEVNFVKMYRNQSDFHQIQDFLAQFGIHLVDFYEKHRQNQTLAWCTALFAKRS